jgi:hypothetical protein
MKMRRPACPVLQLGREVDVQMYVPGLESSVSQFWVKSLSWKGSDSLFIFRPRTVL